MSFTDQIKSTLDTDAPTFTEKSWTDAGWGTAANTVEGALSVRARRVMSKGLSSQQVFENVIAARRGVEASARNLSRAKLRLFGKDGSEIIGGAVYDFFKKPGPTLTTTQMVFELVSWWNIENEMALKLYPGSDKPIASVRVLNPMRLHVQEPSSVYQCADLSDVRQWRYHWHDGIVEKFTPRFFAFAKGFNPNSPIRGLSPFITGNNEASSQYQLTRYNKTFFENNAIPDHVIVLGKGVRKADRDAFEAQYLSQFGTYNDNAHKVFIVSGTEDFDVKNLNQQSREGEFMQLSVANKGDIAALLGVPPIVVGLHDQTRYETAEVQRQQFYEDTLCPQATAISELLQVQVVDPFFAMDQKLKRADAKFSKSMEKAYNDAISVRGDSSVIVLLDTDTMPIMASINTRKVTMAGDLCEKLKLTPNEAATYVALDLPDDTTGMRDVVYVKTTEAPLSNPELMTRMQGPKPETANPDKPRPSEAKPAGTPVGGESRANPKKELTAEQKDAAKKLERLVHGDYRKAFVASIASRGSPPSLCELDGILGEEMKTEIRRDYFHVRMEKLDADGVKKYLNAKYSKIYLRTLSHLQGNPDAEQLQDAA